MIIGCNQNWHICFMCDKLCKNLSDFKSHFIKHLTSQCCMCGEPFNIQNTEQQIDHYLEHHIILQPPISESSINFELNDSSLLSTPTTSNNSDLDEFDDFDNYMRINNLFTEENEIQVEMKEPNSSNIIYKLHTNTSRLHLALNAASCDNNFPLLGSPPIRNIHWSNYFDHKLQF